MDTDKWNNLEEDAKADLLEAVEVTKEAVDEVLDSVMDMVGYTGYRVYSEIDFRRYHPLESPDTMWQDILPLFQDFIKKVNEAIGE